MQYNCELKWILEDAEIRPNVFGNSVGMSKEELNDLITSKTLPSFEDLYNITSELNLDVHEIWTPKVDNNNI